MVLGVDGDLIFNYVGLEETRREAGTGSSQADSTYILDDHYQILLSLPTFLFHSSPPSHSLPLSSLSPVSLHSHSDKQHIIYIHIHRKPHQVLDKLLQVILCRLSFLLASNDGDHFWIVVTRAVGEHHPRSKLIPDLADVSSAPSDQETMVLGLATNLDSVVFLSLKQGGRERKERRKGEGGMEGGRSREGKKDILVECYNSK